MNFRLPKIAFKPIHLVIPVLIALSFTSWFFYSRYVQTRQQLQQLNAAPTPKPVTETLNRLNQLMVLPANETPNIATIADKDKLQNQPFFQQAENGDQIIVYLQSKKAILYRPSINKIIDIAPIQNPAPSKKP